jgi:hypothetical protein
MYEAKKQGRNRLVMTDTSDFSEDDIRLGT